MHRLLPPGVPTQWWAPALNPWLVKAMRPLGKWMQRRQEKLHHIEVRGLEHVEQALKSGYGVLLTPNHFTYADPYLLAEAASQLGSACYFMTAWQVFAKANWFKQNLLQQHGCFSVDRDGADLRAVRQAIEILQDKPHPLVIFPEGEMYHVSDRVMPFHDGAAAIALAASRKAQRPIVCIPTALKYYFLEDPTPQLEAMMARLEERFFWRPRLDLSLEQRLFRVAEAAVVLKELEYLGHTQSGTITERATSLCENVLARLEARFAMERSNASIPQRVTALRRRALAQWQELAETDPRRQQLTLDLDNIFFVTQLFSYPANYIAERPSLERVAETLAKLEEDVLGAELATVPAPRGAVIAFDEPIIVGQGRGPQAVSELTHLLEEKVQELLQTTDVPSFSRVKGDRCRFEVNDVQSRLNATRVEQVVRPTTVDELRAALKEAEQKHLAVSISGGRHAMGGQQFAVGTMLLDMRGMDRLIKFDRDACTVEVEGGIEWPEFIAELHRLQEGQPNVLSIRQKQTGIDRVTIAGTVSANAHGRGLRFPPFASDVESLEVMNAAGELITCSRTENRELFSLVLGGYGLFGIITKVRLRLVPRQKVKRTVKVIKLVDLQQEVETRIAEGYLYGDAQYSTDFKSDAAGHQAVFSCYGPVPDDTPIEEGQKYLTEEAWSRLYGLARADKKKAFETYAGYYLSTNGQVYWSDTHQMSGSIDYYTQVMDRQRGIMPNNTEMIGEFYVTWDKLLDFLALVREDCKTHAIDITYGTIRFIDQDEVGFLTWAKERQVCILCNLNIVHTEAGRQKAAEDFRRLIDRAAQFGGRYFLTYQRWARKDQVEACYPRMVEFLTLKRKYDPQERFQSEWYRHYRAMFQAELAEVGVPPSGGSEASV